MKVLQFAFSEDMPVSIHIPHRHEGHCIVYTGTHDNNTTRGWLENELDEASQRRLAAYLGQTASEKPSVRHLIRLAFQSVGYTVIIPVQDWLNLPRTPALIYPLPRPATGGGSLLTISSPRFATGNCPDGANIWTVLTLNEKCVSGYILLM
ncbi:MAG: hypothetical protein HC880_18660 [Bacteroidia bacterium]|nr:hypothetical protein [Bacteroidia bacterium]